MISSPTPGTFVHVSHVGLDAKGRFESTANIEPGWTMILDELEGYGVTGNMGEKDFDFVEGFLAGAKASLVQELKKTSTAAKIRRTPTGMRRALHWCSLATVTNRNAVAPTELPNIPRPVQRKKVPGYF